MNKESIRPFKLVLIMNMGVLTGAVGMPLYDNGVTSAIQTQAQPSSVGLRRILEKWPFLD